MQDTSNGLETVHNDRLVPAGQIGGIVQRVMSNRILVMDAMARPTAEVIADHPEKIAKNRDEITALWEGFMARSLTPEEAELARARLEEVREDVARAEEALQAGRRQVGRSKEGSTRRAATVETTRGRGGRGSSARALRSMFEPSSKGAELPDILGRSLRKRRSRPRSAGCEAITPGGVT